MMFMDGSVAAMKVAPESSAVEKPKQATKAGEWNRSRLRGLFWFVDRPTGAGFLLRGVIP